MYLFLNNNCITRCEKDYGIFVPATKVMKAGKGYKPNPTPHNKQSKVTTVNFGKVITYFVQKTKENNLFIFFFAVSKRNIINDKKCCGICTNKCLESCLD